MYMLSRTLLLLAGFPIFKTYYEYYDASLVLIDEDRNVKNCLLQPLSYKSGAVVNSMSSGAAGDSSNGARLQLQLRQVLKAAQGEEGRRGSLQHRWEECLHQGG